MAAAAAQPDTVGGNLGTSPAHPAGTTSTDIDARPFLTGSTPGTTSALDARTTADPALPSDLAFPRAADETVVGVRPDTASAVPAIEPVRAVPLPGNSGIAFVPDGYAANVANAFPEPLPGVFRVVAQQRDNAFSLPEAYRPHEANSVSQLVVALRELPARLVSWGDYTTLQLLACDLTPALVERLAPAIRATLGVELDVPYRETPVYITLQGHITTTDPGIKNTLHLATPVRRQ
ncbi:hypothetical protein DMC64_36830 [Amycolatopsis sp. WAC 04197]|nr:hypothetical protein DMC64_36830 [Amycolatopsis sp. WAC 04197]